ncbi:MAG: hypothetical protein ACE5R6_14995 [Candidatus Heimdallarchaeota archaeon]
MNLKVVSKSNNQVLGVVYIPLIMAFKDGVLQEVPSNQASNFEIFAKIDELSRTMHLVIPFHCSMITRRTVERQARSIAKTRFYELVLDESEKVPRVPKETAKEVELAPSPPSMKREPKVPITTETIEPEEPVTEKKAELKLTIPELNVLDEQTKSRLILKTAKYLGFDSGDFFAAMFLWRVLVNTIKLDNVVKLGSTVTLQWDDGGALEFSIEDNKELSNLLVLSVLGHKATLIKDLWREAMNWQKQIKD